MSRRMRWTLLGGAGLLVAFGVVASAAQESAPKAEVDDVKSMDAILAALYDVISGPKGRARDWDRFRSLFVPGARLIPAVARPDGHANARVLDVEEFVKVASASSEKQGFFEREIARKTEEFGHIAHVFSTYESRRAEGDEKPFTRGINSIQLLKDGDRWWVVTIYWDAERPDEPIPEKYLPSK